MDVAGRSAFREVLHDDFESVEGVLKNDLVEGDFCADLLSTILIDFLFNNGECRYFLYSASSCLFLLS